MQDRRALYVDLKQNIAAGGHHSFDLSKGCSVKIAMHLGVLEKFALGETTFEFGTVNKIVFPAIFFAVADAAGSK